MCIYIQLSEIERQLVKLVLSNGRRHGARYWTGEAVSFVCDPEYHLTGPATRVRLASGNWTGVQPSCKYSIAKSH